MGEYMSFICPKCKAPFLSNQELQQHVVGHMLGGKAVPFGTPIVTPAAKKEEKPVEEPKTAQQLFEDEQKNKASQPQQAPVVPVKAPDLKKTANEPIDLHYVYTGTCPVCNTPVKTIPIDNVPEGKVTTCAWCDTCGKKIQQRIVAKI